MQQLLESYSALNSWQAVLCLSLLLLLAALLLQACWLKITRILQSKAATTDNPWDDAFIAALSKPVSVAIGLLAFALGYYSLWQRFIPSLEPITLGQLLHVATLFLLAWFCLRLIKQLEAVVESRPAAENPLLHPQTLDVIAKIAQLLIILVFTLMVLQTFGVKISGLLAVGGAGSLIVGFAAKDLLANFFGGLIVYLDRPFRVGEWISSPDKNIEGTVEKISWRMTCIRNFERRPVYVPNSLFSSIIIQNPSRMTNRRINERIGLRYQDINKLAAILSEIRTLLLQHAEIDSSKTLMVNFDKYSDSALEFFIYAFTKTTQWAKFHSIKEEILLKVAAVVSKHGAEFAFPTRTLHLPEAVSVNSHYNQE